MPCPRCRSRNDCDKCRLLEIQVVSIDLDSMAVKPRGVFTLGKYFPHMRIKIVGTFNVVGSGVVKKTYHLRTSRCGEFCLVIPQRTLNVDLQLRIDLAQKSGGWGCCIKIDGQYAGYEMYDLNWRDWDGGGNNLSHPTWGKARVALIRKAGADYADGIGALAVRGELNPNPRTVSNWICKTDGSIVSNAGISNFGWAFGQFVDHEIDLTLNDSGIFANVITPSVDVDPEEEYPGRTIPLERSIAVAEEIPRQQPNHISAYLDGTNVYGYDSIRSYALRKLDGSGKLAVDKSDNGEDILIYNAAGLPNANPHGVPADELFLAGDIRANENIFLLAMHTLFVREHNRMCDIIVAERPGWVGKEELIYQQARRWVVGIQQAITYGEFLPALLGNGGVGPYLGYNPAVDAGVANEFSTALYRVGHTMLPSVLQVGLDAGETILLRDCFFVPGYVQEHGIDDLLVGLSRQKQQEIDGKVVDDVRNFLFGPPGAEMMLDLATLNIQRGRDHGLPGYNAVRVGYGLARKETFAEITSDVDVQNKLEQLYGHPDYIDPWIGGLVEDHVTGASVGELVRAALMDQFRRIRDGDRFYYENDPALTAAEKGVIRSTRLSDVIIRNTHWTSADIPADVFHVM